MQIGAADADSLHAHQRLSDFHSRLINLDHIQFKWFCANNAFQVYSQLAVVSKESSPAGSGFNFTPEGWCLPLDNQWNIG
jgi:hypothetical protein